MRRAVGTDNENKYSPSADSSYGGSKYRLSYDELGKGNKKGKSLSDKTKIIIIIAAVTAILITFTVLAVDHFGEELKKIYKQRSTTTEARGDAEFQSYVDIVID